MMKLTLTTVGSMRLEGGQGELVVFDSDIPGFGVRLRASGSKSWIFQYRIKGARKQRRLTIGATKAVPLSLARQTASQLHVRVKLGHDPAMDKVATRLEIENTFGALVDKFLEQQRAALRPRSYVEISRHLEKHAKRLHQTPITAISQRGLADLLNDVADTSGPVEGNHVRASLSQFLGWVMREGIRLPDGNVAALTNKRPERSRTRVLSDAELAAIWKACPGDDYGAVIRLLMLTAQRASEIGGLRWAEIEGHTIVLPPERTKNNRAHVVPLCEAARAILMAFRREGYLFGGLDGFKNWGRSKKKLDARLSIPHWTTHDLRRTAATRMADLGVAPHIIEAVLNHVSGHKGGVAGIYNRASYDKEKREALNLWAAHLASIV
jgi:integrase